MINHKKICCLFFASFPADKIIGNFFPQFSPPTSLIVIKHHFVFANNFKWPNAANATEYSVNFNPKACQGIGVMYKQLGKIDSRIVS